MWLERLIRAVGPVIGMAIATRCGAGRFEFNGTRFDGRQGLKLAELDLSGAPPQEVILVSPDQVHIRMGDAFAIEVEGEVEARDCLRFHREGTVLTIMREPGRRNDAAAATVTLTMPALGRVSVAGSGTMRISAMASDAAVVIAGSGKVEADTLAVQRLAVTIAGSGNFIASGSAGKLALTVAGSGMAAMDALKVDCARIEIAGSGNSRFASDGEVAARIVGSGSVTVRGTAKCSVQSFGSGRLVCEPGEERPAAA